MSTYLKSNNTYDNEAIKFFDYEQQRLKLFTEKMNLSNNKLCKPQIKMIIPKCEKCRINDNYSCYMAALNGHLECLKYAHENGCSWNKHTCSKAAFHGHLECLKYAHENGCPWDKWTSSNAACNGLLDCLKYAHENGCPWDYKIISGIKYIKCRNYLHKYKSN